MSNNESFIDEVAEEVRKDRLFGYLRKYGWIAVLAVFAVVGGTAFTEYNKAQRAASAKATGDAILAALEISDDTERAAAMQAIEVQGSTAAVTGLMTAATLVEAGDFEGAATQLEAVALNTEAPQIYRDLATFRLVLVQRDTLSIEERRAGFSGLAVAGSPFRLLAQEQLGYLSIEEGDIEGAVAQFSAIIQSAEVTRGLRDRALAMIVALDGDLEALFGSTTLQADQ